MDGKAYLKNFRAHLRQAFRLAYEEERKNKARTKRNFDRKAKALLLEPGDVVLLQKRKTSKFDTRWEDRRYVVIDRICGIDHAYKVQAQGTNETPVTVNRRRIYPLKVQWEEPTQGADASQTAAVPMIARREMDSESRVQQEPDGAPPSSGPEQEVLKSGVTTRAKSREVQALLDGTRALKKLWDRDAPRPVARESGDEEVD
jgi:hypothetical protein